MELLINGERQSVPDGLTVAELLAVVGERTGGQLSPQRVAIEVNEQLVRRAAFAETALRDGDRVEIVTLVGGG
jgi:sulfur carrier protein